VAAGRATHEILAAAGKDNLIYREYPGLDHFMTDRAGVNNVAEVIEEAAV